ncbi:MAG: hypothetical protein JST54_34395 [Deltaproteobacteria bacterium]|nr:hypothetical protein [Deltaproteobacteria bacterium]
MEKLKMEWLNRRVLRAGGEIGELSIPSGTLAVGDAITGSSGDLKLGVTRCLVGADDLGEEPVIIARARETPVVRWEHAPSGGVDSGVFGIWDSAEDPSDAQLPVDGDHHGFEKLLGRMVYALDTGDGVFSCVTGHDAAGEISLVVAGPGVDVHRFGIVTDEDRADAAKLAARPAGPLGADLCPVVSWFVAPLGQAAEAAALARAANLKAATDAKKSRAQQQKRIVPILGWALRRWQRLLIDLLPAEAARIGAIVPTGKPKIDWGAPVFDIHNYAMSTLRFDLEQSFVGEDAATRKATAIAALTPERSVRVGSASLRELVEHADLGREPGYPPLSLRVVMRALAEALERSLILHALKDVQAGQPDPGARLDALLDALDERESALALIGGL